MKVQLVITNGQLAGTVVPVAEGQSVTFGRSDMSDIVLPDGKASRLHCKVQNEGGGCKLYDLNSSNGTFVNNTRVQTSALDAGDEIIVGETVMIFEVATTEGTTTNIRPRPGLKQPAPPIDPRTVSSPRSPTIEEIPQGPSAALAMGGVPAGMPGAFVQTHKFCSKCGRIIPRKEIVDGKAREVDGKNFCADCADPYLGRIIANYKILEKIGQGSMGIVFRAQHQTMERPAAIKILFEYLTLNKNMVKRFLREARAGASLNHANLVQLYDAGEDEGTFYIAMEFVDGDNLADLLEKQGPMSLANGMDIAMQMATVLDYAYKKRIVHRDIKPGNVILSRDGVAKLIDMGTAKSLQESGLSELTKTGMGIGTINFMSPEQIFDAKNVDHRADIYSMGAMFYFLFTCRLPFQAKSPKEFLAKVSSEKIDSPRKYNAGLPNELCKVIEKMMARNPKDRYQVPAELIAELDVAKTAIARMRDPSKTLPPV
ncbi:MAG: protein kinase [Planctomycetes bacterium]|nr:protein kinase [Planctomycetota bacterium]